MKPATMLRNAARRIAALALSALLAFTCIPVSPDCALADAASSNADASAANTSSAAQIINVTPNASLSATTAAPDTAEIKTVRVGWMPDNPGYQSGQPGERMSGWGYEYLQTLAYYTPGWRYEYVTGTFTELMQKLEAGEIDLMSNISYTDERAEHLLFSSNPQGAERYYIYAKPSRSDLTKGDPAALNGLTIGCVRNIMQTEVGQQWLANESIDCTFEYYDSGEQTFAALSAGDVDAIIMNDTLSSEDAMTMFYVGESNYYLATPNSRPDLMDDINAAMTSIRNANPRYNDEVKTRYTVSDAGSSTLTVAERAWLDARGGAITIGYLDNALPYTNLNDNGDFNGLLSALFDTLESQFGATVNLLAFSSHDKMREALERGTIDAALPVCRDYWLAEQGGFSQSTELISSSLVAVYSGSSLEDALGSIACYPTSLIDSATAAALWPNAAIADFGDAQECINALKSGNGACLIVPASAISVLRDEFDFGNLKTAELPNNVAFSCWTRQGSPKLLSIVNKGIASASSKIEADAYASYTYTSDESSIVRFFAEHQTPILACAFMLLVFVILMLAWALGSAKAAQRQAQSANAAKTAFLARMSHDIRTPLNGIIGLMEVSDLRPSDVQLARENRAKAKTAADHLLSLINDILEMSKIEDRVIELEHKPFNLTDLCRDIFVLGQIRATDRGVTITTSGLDTFEYPDVFGSPTHVRRVFLNLVENCIKYNKPGGTVHCSAALLDVEGDVVRYRFMVADTGIGMTPEFLEHIFEPFTQAHDDARSSYQGTGMGMPIVKGLVEKMGGTINIASTPGEGSTFTVELPFTIDRNPKAHSMQADAPAERSIEGMSVMLAEDNELNTEIAQALLENEKVQVTCVSNGQEAVEVFCAKTPGSFDAILMDIMMPKMNGYEAARAIRRSDRPDAATVPIIAMTANAFAEDVKAAKEAGMNDHLSKPIELDVLKRTLAKYHEQ